MPILAFDAEVRTVVCSTNAIESVNARIRRAVRARGHLPNEAAAPKRVYLAVMSLDPSGQGRRRMDHVLETSPERLRRTPVRRAQVAANNPSTPFVRLTDPPILRHHRM
ncbi:hypothetical protein BAW75_06045 [Micromonospora chalcea]|nr:hypothetical protein BAW75_06045 [Micromonospora chalcea]